MEFSITKTKTETYKIRHSSGLYWADITLDCGKESGRIQIASDYGDWQYYWGACGVSFKEFLMKVGKDYVAGKFKADRWFKRDETVKQFKTDARKALKDKEISKGKLEDILEEINKIEDEGIVERTHMELYISYNCPNLLDLYCDSFPSMQTDYSPSFNQFWNNVWPVFIEELKKEIQVEA